MTQQSYAGLVQSEFGASEKAAILELLSPFFPEPEIMQGGSHYFTPDEVKHLDTLFSRFGLELRSGDDRFDDIEYLSKLWYRLVNGFGGHIECKFMSPALFRLKIKEWPPAFQQYLQAVVQDDAAEAQRLAKELQVEDLSAPMPPPLFGK